MVDFNTFQRQFVLSRGPRPRLPDMFVVDRLDDWYLYMHMTLGVRCVTNKQAQRIGWCLGEPMSLAPSAILSGPDNDTLVVPSSEEEITAALMDWVGPYLFILPRMGIVISDCGARVPCFYDIDIPLLASSPALMGADEQDMDRELLRQVDIERKGWLPFGITAWDNIRRLLPNHVLELGRHRPRRYWPVSAPEPVNNDPLVVSVIGSLLSRIIGKAVESRKAALQLTAGRETRTLLATARPYLNRIAEAVTLVHADDPLDVTVACELAKIAGITHHHLAKVVSTRDEYREWMERTGFVVGDENPRHYNSFRAVNTDLVSLPGLGGEVARAFYWLPSDKPQQQLTPANLLSRLDMPLHATLLKAATAWLETVSQFDLYTVMDLAYIEQRLGCWAAPSPYGSSSFRREVCPFIQKSVFGAMLQLTPEFRRQQALALAIIQNTWPELMCRGFNEQVGRDRYIALFRKITDPVRLRRRFRKIAAAWV